MSDTLKQLRQELADTVTTVTTYTHLPARAATPCAFILAGSPYITGGDTFGVRLVRLQVVLATPSSLNEYETEALDTHVEDTMRELEAAGWTVESVERPEMQDLNGGEVLTTTINVATDATFT